MALEFYPVKVSHIKRLTEAAVAVSFDIPEELKQVFAYLPGQYITIRLNINGQTVNRAYSLCSSPHSDNSLTIGVKQTEHGLVSTYINKYLQVGDSVELMPPNGNFKVDINSSAITSYVLIAGGSGITPLLSITKSVLQQQLDAKILLIYGNRDTSSIMFFEDLELLKDTYSDRFTLIDILEYTDGDNKGILSLELLSTLLTDSFLSSCHYYLCGPQQVMNNAEAVLHAQNIESSYIHREYFTAPITQSNEQVSSIEPTDFTIHVKLYGKEYDIEVESQDSILEAGIKNNIDPPYACQIAACCTCRAKLRSGKVHMESREALTDDEIEEGYILTCQAHPLTSDVFVDYDG